MTLEDLRKRLRDPDDFMMYDLVTAYDILAEQLQRERDEAVKLIRRNRETLAVGLYAEVVRDTIAADDAFIARIEGGQDDT